jgi:sugar/nucleoside kinase (ribokinase family)
MLSKFIKKTAQKSSIFLNKANYARGLFMSPSGTYEILGIGTPIIDHILKVSDSYLETLPGLKDGMQPVNQETFNKILKESKADDILVTGGSCCNTIKGLAHLGHVCAIVGKIGKDEAAQHFLKAIKNANIVPLFYETETPTAQVAVLVAKDGERTFRTLLNASLEMKASDLDSIRFSGVRLVHIEGYSLLCPSLTERAMQLAKASGDLVSLDLSSFEIVQNHKETILDLLQNYVDIVFCNEIEHCRHILW